jgi:serine protease Do
MNTKYGPALMVMAALFVGSLSPLAEPAAAMGAQRDSADIAKKVFPSVVRVEAQNHTRKVATGVVVEKGGYIVTTALISPRDQRIVITTADGKKVEAEFLGFDTETQLALVRAKDAAGLPALAAGRAADLSAGSWICVVGVSPESTPAVTQGIVSSIAEDRLRLNVWVTPGTSGGPVVDDKGRMVGLLRGIYVEEKPVVFQFRDREQAGSGVVISRGEAPSSGMAVAVPVDVVRDVAAQIKDKGRVERGWLGVGIGQDDDGRVVIGQVDRESPAELAKLRPGDVILKVGDKGIAGPDQLAAEIRKRKPGQEITLRIERDGKPQDVKVKLGEYAEADARRELEIRFPRLFPPAPPGQPAKPAAPKGLATPAVPARPSWAFEQRKYIGVYPMELNRELAEHYGVKEGTGLLVSRLTAGGPAEKAGLKVGDVIVRVDGQRVESTNDLIDRIQAKAKGDKVKLEVLREKKTVSLEVEVAEESSGGFFGPEGLRDALESWQGYTDAFETVLKRWRSDHLPEIRENMKRLQEEMAVKSKESAKEVAALVRGVLRRV